MKTNIDAIAEARIHVIRGQVSNTPSTLNCVIAKQSTNIIIKRAAT
jgi:hypothetical protein